eukprot:08400_4
MAAGNAGIASYLTFKHIDSIGPRFLVMFVKQVECLDKRSNFIFRVSLQFFWEDISRLIAQIKCNNGSRRSSLEKSILKYLNILPS